MAKRLYGKRGFTDKVMKIFNATDDPDSAQTLLKIRKVIPKEQLKDRQNKSPPMSKFLEFAKKCPRAKFNSYVIGKEREDERITVDGVTFPKQCMRKAKSVLLKTAHASPDENWKVNSSTRWWWD